MQRMVGTFMSLLFGWLGFALTDESAYLARAFWQQLTRTNPRFRTSSPN
jgi:hypothetical protein